MKKTIIATLFVLLFTIATASESDKIPYADFLTELQDVMKKIEISHTSGSALKEGKEEEEIKSMFKKEYNLPDVYKILKIYNELSSTVYYAKIYESTFPSMKISSLNYAEEQTEKMEELFQKYIGMKKAETEGSCTADIYLHVIACVMYKILEESLENTIYFNSYNKFHIKNMKLCESSIKASGITMYDREVKLNFDAQVIMFTIAVGINKSEEIKAFELAMKDYRDEFERLNRVSVYNEALKRGYELYEKRLKNPKNERNSFKEEYMKKFIGKS